MPTPIPDKGAILSSCPSGNITIPADQSVTGKEIRIDPATGDTTARDLIEIVKNQKDTFYEAQSIELPRSRRAQMP